MSAEDDPAEAPLEYYLNNRLEVRSLDSSREWTYENIVDLLDELVLSPKGTAPQELGVTDIREFIDKLQQDTDLSDNTLNTYLSPLTKMYAWMQREGLIEKNPVRIVLADRDFESGSRRRREISVDEMGSFLKRRCNHPLYLAIFTTFPKTGMRLGELLNLDIQDVHLDHPMVKDAYPACRPELDNRPDTIFVPSEISTQKKYRGEYREVGNKRKRSTYIPIDSELKQILINYLNIRPSVDVVARPFFVGQGGSTGNINQRLSPTSVQKYIYSKAEAEEWRQDGYHHMNVTPHYFRHFFTTHAENRMNPMTVKYLRGDKGNDTKDRYTHNWNNKVRKEYLANIFKLF